MQTIPAFSRIEIRTGSRDDILLAAASLRTLAVGLEHIADHSGTEAAAILAHHAIKETSQKLRGTK